MARARTARAERGSTRPASRAHAAQARGQQAADTGYITVRVGMLPGVINPCVALNGGRTAGDAIAAASLRADGYEIKVNALSANTQTALKQDDTVLLVKKIRGN